MKVSASRRNVSGGRHRQRCRPAYSSPRCRRSRRARAIVPRHFSEPYAPIGPRSRLPVGVVIDRSASVALQLQLMFAAGYTPSALYPADAVRPNGALTSVGPSGNRGAKGTVAARIRLSQLLTLRTKPSTDANFPDRGLAILHQRVGHREPVELARRGVGTRPVPDGEARDTKHDTRQSGPTGRAGGNAHPAGVQWEISRILPSQ